MFLNSALDIVGSFLLGASAGALLQSLRYRSVFASYRQLLNKGDRTYGADPIGCSIEESSATALSTADGFVRHSVSEDANLTRFERWSETLLTCLGAPIFMGEGGRKLTMAERVEWLQAKNG